MKNSGQARRDFARRLSEAMQRRGWNQSELARQAGTSRDNISNYVNAKALPQPHTLHKIAQALDMKPSELLPPRESAASDARTFEAKQGEDGFVMLTFNGKVAWGQLARIADILGENPAGA